MDLMEILKALFGDEALTFEQFAEKVNNAADVKLGNLAGGQYVEKDKYDDVSKKLETANANLEGYDPDWQNKVKQAQLDGDKKLNDYKFEQAVESAINNAGAADLVSVKANIDMSKVSQTEDGSITGLDEQLAELKQSKPFLFKSEEEPKKKLDLGGPTGGAKAKSGSNLKSAVEDYHKMPITLAEASVGRADKVTQEVIDTLRRGSQFMDELTFDDAVSPGVGGSTLTYGYLQLQTPSTAAGREINSEYTANEAKKIKKTVDLKIFGGASEVDRVIQEATTNEIAFQLEQKTLATRNHFQNCCINGSKTNKSVDFDGLTTLLKGTSTEYNAGSDKTVVDLSTTANLTSNYQTMIDMLNEFIGGIDGKPTFLLGNSKLIAKLKSVAQRAGYLTKAEDAFGKTAQGYDNIIFYDMGNYYNGSATVPCVPIYETGASSSKVTGLTDLYAVQLGLDAFHGVSLSGSSIIKTYMPDLTAPGAVKKAEVEMVAAVALKNTTKCGVFRNIKVS